MKKETETVTTSYGAEKSPREAGFELLRILAMFGVVVMHYLARTDALLSLDGPADSGRLLATFTESVFVCAVNAYVLISGYFLSEKAMSFRRVIRLAAQVLFYTLLIPAALLIVELCFPGNGMTFSEVFDLYHLWNCIFPVQSGHYWFVTSYVILCLFSPFLNKAIDHMSRKEFKCALAGLLVFFCLGKSLSIVVFASDAYGYDFGWFICLYLTGAYIRRYGMTYINTLKKGVFVYLGSAAGIFGLTVLAWWLYQRTGAFEYYFTVPFHYNFLLCFGAALGLFAVFSKLSIKEGKGADKIRFISPAVFGVYLIHEHVDIADRWLSWMKALCGGGGQDIDSPVNYFGFMILQVLIVFVFCIFVDKVRILLFKWGEKRFFPERSSK